MSVQTLPCILVRGGHPKQLVAQFEVNGSHQFSVRAGVVGRVVGPGAAAEG
ncbi:hypothetical protein JOF29_004336 [Kribbella aluminosa]|uniref:Uncharacterized protein n=1 Tax=Kribbella aluminosa TaxID=416017 RepID=A0ABS4UNM9_9ACTN|nr:hypothetical protein [Kribbella aluminosa]